MPGLPRMNRDRWGALLLMATGVAVAAKSMAYRMGSLTHMGPGFMPAVYGVLIAVVGLALWVTTRPVPDAKAGKAEWRGWLCILAGVFAFAILAEHGGLVPATFASVFISAMGDRKNSWRDALLLAAGMSLVGWIIFNVLLKLPLAAFQWG